MTFDTYLANSQTYHCMSGLALGPGAYVAPQMRHDVSQVHRAADLMVVPLPRMDEK